MANVKLLKKTGMFLQTRLNSSRMPGKAIIDLNGKPLVIHAMERLNVIPADIRVILTTKESEAGLRPLAQKAGWDIFVGSTENVLERYVKAILHYNVDVVIRATGDNPLLSSEIAIETLDIFNKENCDLAYIEPIPYGSGVEIVKAKTLITALKNTKVPYDLEHVTPYIYKHKDKFKIRSANFSDQDVARTDVRLSIDTRDDYEKINFLLKTLRKNSTKWKIRTIIEAYDKLKFIKYKKILFITAFGDDFGMGHLKRILFIAKELQNDFQIFFSFKHGDEKVLSEINDIDAKYIAPENLENHIKDEGIFDRVIVDLRDTTIEEMTKYKSLGPTISIDDMGPGGQLSVINARTLPSLEQFKEKLFNFDGLEYLLTEKEKNNEKQNVNNPPQNVLITFGGSDPANLSTKTAEIFSQLGYKVTLVVGAFVKEKINKSKDYTVLNNISNLKKYIKDADLVVTSFGMTFMESIIQKRPVLLLNPSNYHDNLTEDFKYPYFIKRENTFNLIERLKTEITRTIDKMNKENAFQTDASNSKLSNFFSLNLGENFDDIVELVKEWSPTLEICPYCCNTNNKTLHRTKNWNMYKCKRCNLTYLTSFKEEKKDFEDDYFLTEYKNQYGKTYEEDREHIRSFAKKRLDIIKKYVDNGKLLDFGAGLGFFAEYAEENGFKTTSVDISKYAVKYINTKLNLNALQGDQNFFDKNNDFYDVITSFYVIEHIKDFEKLIFLFACHLKENGILALATPNGNGISIRFNFQKYIKNHPPDHLRIFTPGFIKKTLRKYHFTNIKIVITGIHIERFNLPEKLTKIKIVRKVLYRLAQLLQLGDTFEVYAQNTR